MKNIEEHHRTVFFSRIILLVLILAAIGGSCNLVYYLGYVRTDEASVDGVQVTVSSKMLGRIRELFVDEGTAVKAGQIIAILSDNDLRTQENQFKTGLIAAQKNVVLVTVGLKKAQADFERANIQYKDGCISKEQYENSQSALETTQAQYSIALAQVNNTRAQLEVIRTELLNTKIYAPIPGIIAKRSVRAGEIVQPGQAIVAINNLGEIWITANFEETEIWRLKVKQLAKISVDAYPFDTLYGHVVQIGAGIVPPPFMVGDTKTTQKLPVRILLKHVPRSIRLVPGMSVEVKIKSNSNFLRTLWKEIF